MYNTMIRLLIRVGNINPSRTYESHNDLKNVVKVYFIEVHVVLSFVSPYFM